MIVELLEALKKAQHDCEGLRHRLDQLLRRLYGPKAERFDPNQPWLVPDMAAADANEPAAPALPPAGNEEASAKSKRPGHGRKKLPADLPRRRLEHTLPEGQRLCPDCGDVCQKFGEDVHEQLDYQPASLFVCQHVRFKYACPKCHDHVTTAPAPIAVIDKGSRRAVRPRIRGRHRRLVPDGPGGVGRQSARRVGHGPGYDHVRPVRQSHTDEPVIRR
jgi:hypothetical protein